MGFDFARVGGSRRRADRLLQIVEMLRHHRSMSIEQLAERLEVSKRTVYRDLDALDARGVRIRNVPGEGYALDRQALLPPLHFEDGESEALVLGLRMAAAWVDPTLGAAAHSALEKLEAVMSESSAAVLTHVRLFAPRGAWARAARDGLEPVRSAIANRRKLWFVYARLDGRTSRRTVRPLGLHFWGSVWTLAAWCERRRDYRSFRVDRMSELEALDVECPADGPDLAGFLAQRETGGDSPPADGMAPPPRPRTEPVGDDAAAAARAPCV